MRSSKIQLLNFKSPAMRSFHISWMAFFLCFFAWFGIAPLMAVVRNELQLTQSQIGNLIIVSVLATIAGRLFFGWLCDRIGPRLSYTYLLVLGSIPVMGIGFSDSYESFLVFRLLIGLIGASFVITQYHTSIMFKENIIGTANAMTAGWGNLGGGAAQIVVPMIFSLFVGYGFSSGLSWRITMLIIGILCLCMGVVYFFLTQDTAEGNYKELRERGELPSANKKQGTFVNACKDERVWRLFIIYGACFGVELTINNIAALYFMDYFHLSLKTAGIIAGLYGIMNIFSRILGGHVSDRLNLKFGIQMRLKWLFATLFAEGVLLIIFSQISALPAAVLVFIAFALCVQMSTGATFSVVPLVNRKAMGSVVGIVGAGGNFGAVAAGFLFKSSEISWPTALMILGGIVMLISFVALTIQLGQEKTVHKKMIPVRILKDW